MSLSMLFVTLGFMLQKMSTLSDSRKDNLVEFNNFQTSIVKSIIEQITRLQPRKNSEDDEKAILSFIWDALLLAVLLSLWWLSDKGKKEIEKIFSQFTPTKHKDKWKNVPYGFYNELNKIVSNDAERLEIQSYQK